MNPEILKYFIALQPVIKKAMGEWQVGDRVWVGDKESIVVFVYEDGVTLQPIPRGLRFVLCPDDPALLRLLPTIDDSGKGRGLVDMCENISAIRPIYSILDKGILYWEVAIEPGDTNTYYYPGTPQLALLKAIAAQEGIEV